MSGSPIAGPDSVSTACHELVTKVVLGRRAQAGGHYKEGRRHAMNSFSLHKAVAIVLSGINGYLDTREHHFGTLGPAKDI